MHNSHFLLKALAPVLQARLHGHTLVSCFCQNKDELVFEFNNRHTSFFIRALLAPSFSCLTFPLKFSRAKKNSIDLFTEMHLQPVKQVTAVANERSLVIELENEFSILFKLHGNRSNTVLLQHNTVIDVFRKQLRADWSLTTDQLARPIDWSQEGFVQALGQLEKTYFIFGQPVWEYLHEQGFEAATEAGKWQLFQSCLDKLNRPRYYLNLRLGLPVFSLLPQPGHTKEWDDPLEALNQFSAAHLAVSAFQRTRAAYISRQSRELKKTVLSIASLETKLQELEGNRQYWQWGDLIMANLHGISPGSTEVTTENFYANQAPVTIPLKPALSPQKNAENYYRKAKNQSIEKEQLQQALLARRQAREQLAAGLAQALRATHAGELVNEPASGQKEKAEPATPFYAHTIQHYQVMIGKNAAANDLLLRQFAHKNDLWLHVRDAPGSHVIIRQRAGQPFPKTVIETAASWAAFHSKRKTESLVPVAYTLCKYVRKRKGDPPGAVVTERETTVLVPPAAP